MDGYLTAMSGEMNVNLNEMPSALLVEIYEL